MYRERWLLESRVVSGPAGTPMDAEWVKWKARPYLDACQGKLDWASGRRSPDTPADATRSPIDWSRSDISEVSPLDIRRDFTAASYLTSRFNRAETSPGHPKSAVDLSLHCPRNSGVCPCAGSGWSRVHAVVDPAGSAGVYFWGSGRSDSGPRRAGSAGSGRARFQLPNAGGIVNEARDCSEV